MQYILQLNVMIYDEVKFSKPTARYTHILNTDQRAIIAVLTYYDYLGFYAYTVRKYIENVTSSMLFKFHIQYPF